MSNFHYAGQFFCLRGGDSSRVGGVLSELIDLELAAIARKEAEITRFLHLELRDE